MTHPQLNKVNITSFYVKNYIKSNLYKNTIQTTVS